MTDRSDTQYAFCICHESLSKYGSDNAGTLKIDIRGWDRHAQKPCAHFSLNGFQLERLTIQTWYSEKFTETYGTTMGVDLGRDLMTLEDLERYTRPLKVLQKKLDALQQKYGHPTTIGQTMAYVADALRLSRFARPNHNYASGWQSTTNVQRAIMWCDVPIMELHEKYAQRATETADIASA